MRGLKEKAAANGQGCAWWSMLMLVCMYQGGNRDPWEMIAVLSVCGNPIFTMAACCGEWAAPGSQVPESGGRAAGAIKA